MKTVDNLIERSTWVVTAIALVCLGWKIADYLSGLGAVVFVALCLFCSWRMWRRTRPAGTGPAPTPAHRPDGGDS